MEVQIEESWKEVLSEYFDSENFAKLADFVREQYVSCKQIYPAASNIFNAFNLTPFSKVKLVIIGQDPYHQPNQAHGLSFSVLPPTAPPPSLKNIFKEIEAEFSTKSKVDISGGGDLTPWARQGVMLLNSVLTVERSKPGSHANRGWEGFTDFVITRLSESDSPKVFLLWGNYAKNKASLINSDKHLVLTAAHPSPFSAHNGFFGCGHFKKANEYLVSKNLSPIDW